MEKYVCCDCVGESYLSDEIKKNDQEYECSYCNNIAKSYLINDLADRIATAFEQHYIRTDDQPEPWQHALLSDRESNYEWEREGEQTIYAIVGAVDVTEEVATDIQDILLDKLNDHSSYCGEEAEFDSEAHYEVKDVNDYEWQEKWWTLEKSLKTETRFFNRKAEHILNEIFNGIKNLKTYDGHPIIVDAGPNTNIKSIFRARVFQSEDKLKEAMCHPDKYLGSPQPIFARAGRMNSHGISAFYGANDKHVAISEVRPPVGSKVMVGEFEIIRSLKLLDLTALNDIIEEGSIFDSEYLERLERSVFLRNLSKLITKPIMPDDEAFEYLVTQAIADYLSNNEQMQLDGIIFPSAQAASENGLNFVLFQKAARIENIDRTVGSEISVNTGYYTEEGYIVDYSINIRVPSKSPDSLVETQDDWGMLDIDQGVTSHREIHDSDFREPTLQVLIDSIFVHHILRSKFKTDEYNVKNFTL